MEPLIIIAVPGLLGGILLALVLIRVQLRPEAEARKPLQPPSTSMINMSRIRVDGLGGLGMVAMAATVAIFVPRIRLSIVIALILGIALAALLIARRRQRGPLPSSSDHSGAHSIFINDPPEQSSSGHSAHQRLSGPRLIVGRRPICREIRPSLSGQ